MFALLDPDSENESGFESNTDPDPKHWFFPQADNVKAPTQVTAGVKADNPVAQHLLSLLLFL